MGYHDPSSAGQTGGRMGAYPFGHGAGVSGCFPFFYMVHAGTTGLLGIGRVGGRATCGMALSIRLLQG